jgi:ketosteroid isomerase-like protein
MLVTAARNSDDATIAKYLSPNVTVIDGSGLSRGRVSYLARARSMPSENAGHGALRDFRVHDVGIHQIGDMGWITYTYRLNAPPASGKGPRREIFGFATLILQKVAGRWQIVHAQTAGRAPKSTDPSF